MSGIPGHRGLLMLGTSGLVPEAASILGALVSWWGLDENGAGSTFADLHGSYDLTARVGASVVGTSSVSATGKVSRALDTRAADRTAYSPLADGFAFPNADWSLFGWAVLPGNVSGSARGVAGRLLGGGSGVMAQAGLTIDSSDNSVWFRASSDGSTLVSVASGHVGNGVSWSFFAATFDRKNNLLRLRARRQSPAASVNLTAAFPSALYTGPSNANFSISDWLGNDSSFFAGDRHAAGLHDEWGYCLKALTDAEFDYLYNGGAGRSYAALVAHASS